MQDCPCGTGKKYSDCCGKYIEGKQLPSTPEELMRSRYTAYTQANIDYIIYTMKSPAADNFDSKIAREWAQQVQWIKLDVLQATSENSKGFVEFQAHYSRDNQRYLMHELSEFHREHGQWYYVSGKEPKT